MKAGGYSLGGEQSGHVIMLDHATTGDGMLTGLHAGGPGGRDRRSARRARRGHDPTAAGAGQRHGRRQGPASTPTRRASAAVAEAEPELGDTGRVLLRTSGTEPLVRVMVEAARGRGEPRQLAERLVGVVREHLALGESASLT